MHTYIGFRATTVTVTFAIRMAVTLEAGIWTVREADDCEHAVTSLAGIVDPDGVPHFGIPKGVGRRPSGAWGAREQLLLRALPRNHPRDAWAAIPDEVREVIQESYLLARDESPLMIGTL
jgi:hypothetical protein